VRLPGIPEEVERVESFDDLHDYDIVWFIDCGNCGDNHRLWLKTLKPDPKWSVVDQPPCAPHPYSAHVGLGTVATGGLFRVVDPALESTQATTARKRQPVRT
jgi:hypothetical protein